MRRAVIVTNILFLLGRLMMKQGMTSVCAAGLSSDGAMTLHNKHCVATPIANAIVLVVSVLRGGWLDFVVNGLYLFPHVFLLYYLHTVIIVSKEKDAHERQSCCCV
jgi:hypothetical protein